jgi:hypothetical protein
VEWPEVLDDMESRLVDVDRVLATGGAAVSPFVLPDDLGPLPDELRQRATHVLHETRAQQAAAEDARERLAEALRQSRTAARQPASYLDIWA